MSKPLFATVALSALLLGACGTDDSIPPANETPMEDMQDGAQEMVPDMTSPETNGDQNGNDMMPNNGNDVSPTEQDRNKETDKGMKNDVKKNEEDMMEDGKDMEDADNKDE